RDADPTRHHPPVASGRARPWPPGSDRPRSTRVTVTTELQDFITGLPKAELHLHIEGTLEPELTFALAQRNGIELEHSSAEEVRASYDFDSLSYFLTVYYDSMRVLVTADDFYDLAT